MAGTAAPTDISFQGLRVPLFGCLSRGERIEVDGGNGDSRPLPDYASCIGTWADPYTVWVDPTYSPNLGLTLMKVRGRVSKGFVKWAGPIRR